MTEKRRPRSSWGTPADPERSPLRGLAELDPPIVITDEARRKAAERLEKALIPYSAKAQMSTRPPYPRAWRGSRRLRGQRA